MRKHTEKELFGHGKSPRSHITEMNQLVLSISETSAAVGPANQLATSTRAALGRPSDRQRPTATRWVKLLLFLALASVCNRQKLSAQELTRDSFAGPEAEQAAINANTDESNYNLRIGPVRVLLDATAGFEYIDNITYSEHDRGK